MCTQNLRNHTIKGKIMQKYLLIDDVPVDCTDDEYWDWKETEDKYQQTALGLSIAWDNLNGVIVSTCFLGEAKEISPSGNPLVFETFICGGSLGGECRQSTTLAAAKYQHNRLVDKVVQKMLEEGGELEGIGEIDTEVIDESELSIILGED
jgi:hypothetical protein